MHAKIEDTVEFTTSAAKKKKKKGVIANLVGKIKDFAQEVKTSKQNQPQPKPIKEEMSTYSFGVVEEEPEIVPQRTIKDDVKDILITAPMRESGKKYLLEDKRVEYMLPILTKYMAIPDLEQRTDLVEQIDVILYYVETPEQAQLVDKFLSEPKLYENSPITHTLQNVLMCVPWSKKDKDYVMEYIDFLSSEECNLETDEAMALAASFLNNVTTDEQI